MQEIKLETKLVGSIAGRFVIPSYQRGYRWGKEEVVRLLEDIYANGNNNYCLQPVVVRKKDDCYEVIDGQQRLTTIFILLQYIKKEFKPRIEIKYNINYKTREKSAEFLANIDEIFADTNIDFFHIYHAYEAINKWFEDKEAHGMDIVVIADDMYGYLVKFVKIIWYEVEKIDDKDAIKLFTRLNIGKIPLTSAELVKAMFLSRDNNKDMTQERQQEIALQWDSIERQLHDNSLWYFLTNISTHSFKTHIDLILELIADKEKNNKEKYHTFFYFNERYNNGENLIDIWNEIQYKFLMLKDWYEDHELYHKIGYLVAAEVKTLKEIFDISNNKTKTEFKVCLDEYIRESIKIDVGYEELSYEKTGDYDKISRLLLLFNVESMRILDEQVQRFPFDRYKDKKLWSLEHIHAQQSEGMKDQKVWKEWLSDHAKSIKSIGGHEDLLSEMMAAIENSSLKRNEFETLQEKVVNLLSVEGNTEYLHSISNLALLNTSDNAALNNSTFDVKRNHIIDMDKKGKYIPFCTKMVFLKYYTPSADNKIHFWGQADRTAYVEAINQVLEKYGVDSIIVERRK